MLSSGSTFFLDCDFMIVHCNPNSLSGQSFGDLGIGWVRFCNIWFDLYSSSWCNITLGSKVSVFRLISPTTIVRYWDHQQDWLRLFGPAHNALLAGHNVVFHCVLGQVQSAVLRWQTFRNPKRYSENCFWTLEVLDTSFHRDIWIYGKLNLGLLGFWFQALQPMGSLRVLRISGWTGSFSFETMSSETQHQHLIL
jgi:hypothetical protein